MMSLADTRVVVTGADGFVGRAVTRALLAERAAVTAWCGLAGEIPAEPGVARTVRGDICDPELADDALAGAELVVHLAGPASVAESHRWPGEFLRVHGEGTANVLRAAARARRVVYISSAEVYGSPAASPVAEDTPLDPQSPYAAAKVTAERHVAASGIPATILRPFSLYGPGSGQHGVFSAILDQARHAAAVELLDLGAIRDWCFVADLAEAVVRAGRLERPDLTICNIGSGHGTSVGDLARTVLRAVGRPDLPVRQVTRRADRPDGTSARLLVASRRRAEARLGWIPRHDLDAGVHRTLAALYELQR